MMVTATSSHLVYVHRWECDDDGRHEPILLGKFNDQGIVQIKIKDRWMEIDGLVRVRCPMCGQWRTFRVVD